MKVLITGGSGFVGSHLAKRLSEDHEVTVGDLDPENSVTEIPEEVDRKELDVTESDTLDFEGYDAVVHLVALSPLKKPGVPYRKVHVEGTMNILEEAEGKIGHLVHISALGADPGGSTEYIRTKGEAEEEVEESNLKYTVLRPSIMFGEGGEFIPFIRKVTTPYLTLLPGKNTLFQPLHVEDTAEMVANILGKEEYFDSTYEIGGPKKMSLGDITELVYLSEGSKTVPLKLPMPLFGLAMMVSEHLPTPFGLDQYRSMKEDNVTGKNQTGKLGVEEENLKRFEDFLVS